MFFDNLRDVKKYCNDIICFYTDNDPYVKFETEKECARYEAANELVNIMPIFKKVKKICSEQETCYSCVFNNTSGDCIFAGTIPSDWSI